jgi:hypothetical protein
MEIMALEPDIIDRVLADFGPTESSAALDALSASGTTGRLARCIVFAAGGSLDRLRELIGMADHDYRDVIVAGEYDGAMRQVRDLRVSFLIASPADFWIGKIAATADKHAFRLTSIESQPATAGPFDYTCDRGEGRATFSDGETTLTIIKRDRLWAILPNGDDFRPFGLNDPIRDEDRFRVQLDYYLSRK